MAPQLSPTGMLDVFTTPRPGFTVLGDDFAVDSSENV
jgi:hypothetical protein